jgi:hypothetical protein
MRRNRIAFGSLLLVLVATPYVVYGTYDQFWWLDNLAHLVGGIAVAVVALGLRPKLSSGEIVVLLVGIQLAWETVEVLFQTTLTPLPPTVTFVGFAPDSFNIWFEDSLLDTLLAVLGGRGIHSRYASALD